MVIINQNGPAAEKSLVSVVHVRRVLKAPGKRSPETDTYIRRSPELWSPTSSNCGGYHSLLSKKHLRYSMLLIALEHQKVYAEVHYAVQMDLGGDVPQ